MKYHLCIFGLVTGALSIGCGGQDGLDLEGLEFDSIQSALPGSPMCGDGYLDPGEQCDDGNLEWADGCGSTCQIERQVSIAPGHHKLKNLAGKCIDVAGGKLGDGANVIVWDCHGNDNQLWNFTPWNGNSGYFGISAKHSDKCMDVSGASLQVGANVIQWGCGNLPEHRAFAPSSIGGPYFSLYALHSDRCLGVENGSVVQKSCDGSPDQAWIQERVGMQFSPGAGELRNRADNRCADISGNSTGENANMIAWSCHGGQNQRFDFAPTANDYSQLVISHSGKCVDVYPESVLGGIDGQNVRQISCDGNAENQEFIAIATDSGYFELRAKHSDMCLDIEAGGNNIIQSNCDGSLTQQWIR